MLKPSFPAAALAAACAAAPLAPAHAADAAQDLAQMREELRQMKQDYEARIRALEQRLQATEAAGAAPATSTLAASPAPASETAPAPAPAPAPVPVPAPAPAPAPAAGSVAAANPNAYNPAISAILGGTYARLSQDPRQYRIQGFVPGGEDIGPGQRSFSLGESELTLTANVDPQFAGRLTFALAGDNSVSVEEAYFQTRGLAGGFNGLNLKGGRMLSGIGYLNGIHRHAWDFVDAPLAYQAFLGGQYKTDGAQLTWLAPTERYFELGLEAGNGGAFPGNDRNRNGAGAAALFAHVGDDIGESASWRLGLSWLHTGANDRAYTDTDSAGMTVSNAISGRSNTWVADGIYKWAPNGNATRNSFKLQGEYFRRRESGSLAYDTAGSALTGPYSSAQSGWYLQGVYQFMPKWRTGLRYDRLQSGTAAIGLVDAGRLSAADFPALASYRPQRVSLMLDYSPSEFSRLRLQLAQDKSRPNGTDKQVFLQYIMSLGVHGAHTF